jgi:high-affinity Fe2+/Pb2+ permease
VYPLVLSLVPPARSGLGMGLYLGGAAASTCLFGAFLLRLEAQPLLMSMGLGAIAFALAAGCVWALPKQQRTY